MLSHTPEDPRAFSKRSATERKVITTMHRNGPMPSAEIARATGLSAQSASVITRTLEADGLVMRGEPIRGRVGKPSVPLSLDPDGMFSFGLKIGRRLASLVVVDFLGNVRHIESIRFAYPQLDEICDFVGEAVPRIKGDLPGGADGRFAGLGIAAPFELWNWLEQLDAPRDKMEAWRDVDLEKVFGALTSLPVVVGNDVTLACCGELVFGAGRELSEFAYFYVGAFVGGGLVLNGQVYAGSGGNAGAFGSMPVGPGGTQLLEHASLYLLERQMREAGYSFPQDALSGTVWTGFEAVLAPWLDTTARHLAAATVAVTAVLDIPHAIIDGVMPDDVRRRLVDKTRAHLAGARMRGIRRPEVTEGMLGRMAGARGSAYQPIMLGYLEG